MLGYGALRKPSLYAVSATIGIAWGVLETLLAVTGYRLLAKPAGTARGGLRDKLTTAWRETPATFFGGKKLGASAAVATAVCASTEKCTASKVDEVAAGSMTPWCCGPHSPCC